MSHNEVTQRLIMTTLTHTLSEVLQRSTKEEQTITDLLDWRLFSVNDSYHYSDTEIKTTTT